MPSTRPSPSAFSCFRSSNRSPREQIKNLVTAYRLILTHLSQSPSPALPLYFFVEHGEFVWIDLSIALRDALEKKGLVSHELQLNAPPGYYGTNSRSRSERLKELGWAPEDFGDVRASVEEEVEVFLRHE